MEHRDFLTRFLPQEALLRGFLAAATGNLHEAEDLLQEVSIAAWERFAEYDPARPFRPWLIGFAKVEVLRWRQRKGRPHPALPEGALEALAETAEKHADLASRRRELLSGCLKGLSENLREALRERYLEGMSVGDVARRLGKSVAAVEMSLVRARRALKECVDHELVRLVEMG